MLSCRVESSCMVETFLLTSSIIRHQLSDRRPLRFTVTRGAEDDGSKSHWEALGALVVKGWPQWPAQDWSGRLQLQAELEWRTRRTWPTWRWSRLRPLTDLRTEEETWEITLTSTDSFIWIHLFCCCVTALVQLSLTQVISLNVAQTSAQECVGV